MCMPPFQQEVKHSQSIPDHAPIVSPILLSVGTQSHGGSQQDREGKGSGVMWIGRMLSGWGQCQATKSDTNEADPPEAVKYSLRSNFHSIAQVARLRNVATLMLHANPEIEDRVKQAESNCPSCLSPAGSPIPPTELPPPPPGLVMTNRTPTGPEAAHSRDTIRSAEKKISQIQAMVDDLEKQRAELLGLIAMHRAVISPIKRCPPELLAEIFAKCVDGAENSEYLPTKECPPLMSWGYALYGGE
ncbi:hypothetical protein BD779DRAFT_1472878 [Infundibulicybe gibba]|nr:hypothetical protein BD779DRAFT_1472878 [Infundibulicybe gibba]